MRMDSKKIMALMGTAMLAMEYWQDAQVPQARQPQQLQQPRQLRQHQPPPQGRRREPRKRQPHQLRQQLT